MTPDFACILAIFACSGKTGWQRRRPVPPVFAQNCELTEKPGDFPAQSPYRRAAWPPFYPLSFPRSRSVFAVARQELREDPHERVDTLLDPEKTSLDALRSNGRRRAAILRKQSSTRSEVMKQPHLMTPAHLMVTACDALAQVGESGRRPRARSDPRGRGSRGGRRADGERQEDRFDGPADQRERRTHESPDPQT
jgi:hypothetical protein